MASESSARANGAAKRRAGEALGESEGRRPSDRVLMRAIQVAVPVPGLGPLTYAVPDGVPDLPVGARVLVPLGKRVVTGVVLPEAGNREPEAESCKPITDVLDTEPFLPADVVDLAAWVADYYA